MKYIRRISLMLLAFLITVVSLSGVVSAEGEIADNPGINSGNAFAAYCIDDDQFLYSKRLDEKVAPTVATKLVALMVASDILKERGLKSDTTEVTITAEAIANSGDIADVRVPVMGYSEGSVRTVRELFSATLVACANDAVAAIACDFGERYLGGGIMEFVARMNKKAEELGLQSTKFENPTGLDSANQYSTLREVVKIAAAFYQYDELVKLSDVESYFNGKSTVRNKNYLKCNYYVDGYLNKNAIGLIAGQLNKAGNYCLITASQKEGRTYIFVVMCASGLIVTRDEENRVSYSLGAGNAYTDMNKLINWTREAFVLLPVATTDNIVGELRVNSGETDHAMVVPAQNIEKLVINVEGVKLEYKLILDESTVYKKIFNGKEFDTIDAPLSAGQRVGTVVYSYNGNEVARVDAVIRDNIDGDGLKSTMDSVGNFLFGDVMLTIIYVIGGLIALWILITVVMAVIRGVLRARESGKLKGADYTENEKKPQKTKKTTKDKNKKAKKSPNKETDDKTATREMH
ncbi:MAG: D-alanyl-D-alanine carboxypeptidase [Clostridia bacterium]|nr:D-alanyl-D-alanine carboxypeptidase [Clostridia bacterium]